MKTIRKATLDSGKKVWLLEESGQRWIFFDENGEFDETSGQPVPEDSLDYTYTHAGKEYQEACEKLGLL